MAMSKYEKSRLATLELRPRILVEFLPLFDHLISLAADSHKVGYAKAAGIELLQARRLLKYGER
jgi:hypothetical protein